MPAPVDRDAEAAGGPGRVLTPGLTHGRAGTREPSAATAPTYPMGRDQVPGAVWKCRAAGAGRTPPPQQSIVENTGEEGLSRAIRVINRFSACFTRHELLKQTHWFAGSRTRVGVSDEWH